MRPASTTVHANVLLDPYFGHRAGIARRWVILIPHLKAVLGVPDNIVVIAYVSLSVVS
jgi:hypothetical protein